MILTMNNPWNLMDEVFNHPQRETRNMRIEDDVLTMEFDVPGYRKRYQCKSRRYSSFY